MSDWIRVTAQQPCPVCEKPDWCTVSKDGATARCMRAESGRESIGADGQVGWVHKLDEPVTVDVRSAQKVEKLPQVEVERLAKQMYKHTRAADIRESLAEALQVSAESLDKLRVGYGVDYRGREFASFPSRNAHGKVIGIVRRFGVDGSKMTYPGTKNGIFYCMGWSRYPGPVLIVEGASDVAAALTVGLCAIGRSSNLGGADMIQTMVKSRCNGRNVLVVGERDEKPGTCEDCDGCAMCWPGKHGARETAKRLGCDWLLPPEKDLRACVASGRLWPEVLRMWPNNPVVTRGKIR